MNIKITNWIGLPVKNCKIEVIDCSKLFEGKKEVISEAQITNQQPSFMIAKPGAYILRISTKRSVFETFADGNTKIRMPFFYRFRHIELNSAELDQLSEKFRWDQNKCYHCKKKPEDHLTSRFKCHYCHKFFCSSHRIPEDHNCQGNPKLPKEMRHTFESWTFPRKN